jgi:hypothetical protein
MRQEKCFTENLVEVNPIGRNYYTTTGRIQMKSSDAGNYSLIVAVGIVQ